MKEMYLTNSHVGYLFAEGAIVEGRKPYSNPSRRQEWGRLDSVGLVGKLRKAVNPKRKSTLHADNIHREFRQAVAKVFKGTRVHVDFASVA